jgi:hypothetical protein
MWVVSQFQIWISKKGINLMNSLFGTQSVDQKEVKLHILRQLIDEIIIVNEAQKLNMKLSNKELDNFVALFLAQNFKLKADEVDQYAKNHNIDISILKKQIECQLLWNKIIEARVVPFINITAEQLDTSAWYAQSC